MSYCAEISRDNPAAFVFLIDQSYSMSEQSDAKDINRQTISRADAVADVINSILEELLNTAIRDEGIRDYFDIALIGYGGDQTFLWEGELKNQCFAKISEIKDIAQHETIIEEIVVRGRIHEEKYTKLTWLKAKAENGTPMKGAFAVAEEEIKKWVAQHKKSYPPIVINITDGEANDITSPDELIQASQRIQNIATEDGHTIVLNIHISNHINSIVFPSQLSQITIDQNSEMLFKMSSVLPPHLKSLAQEIFKIPNTGDLVGLAVNASIVELVKILDIGTRPVKEIGFNSESRVSLEKPSICL